MVTHEMMSRFGLYLLLVLGAACTLRAGTTPVLTTWDRITVAPMKTSIYVGTVKLTTGVLARQDSTLVTTYEARVWPWFFWSETGRITITLTDADLAHLAKGETAVFTGRALSSRNKPRQVTGRAQPADASSGKIKVRISVDNTELIFNGTYQLGGAAN